MSVVVAQALSNPEVQKNLIAAGLGILESAPAVLLATAGITILQWQLEHTAINKEVVPIFKTKTITKTVQVPEIIHDPPRFGNPARSQTIMVDKVVKEKQRVRVGETFKWSIRRLSTKDTSILNKKKMTPLSPPIMSMATRAGDTLADTGEAAFALAQQQLQTVGKKGAIAGILEFLLGGG